MLERPEAPAESTPPAESAIAARVVTRKVPPTAMPARTNAVIVGWSTGKKIPVAITRWAAAHRCRLAQRPCKRLTARVAAMAAKPNTGQHQPNR